MWKWEPGPENFAILITNLPIPTIFRGHKDNSWWAHTNFSYLYYCTAPWNWGTCLPSLNSINIPQNQCRSLLSDLSSVGRAEDCRGAVILRSLVRIRQIGFWFFLCLSGNSYGRLQSMKKFHAANEKTQHEIVGGVLGGVQCFFFWGAGGVKKGFFAFFFVPLWFPRCS